MFASLPDVHNCSNELGAKTTETIQVNDNTISERNSFLVNSPMSLLSVSKREGSVKKTKLIQPFYYFSMQCSLWIS